MRLLIIGALSGQIGAASQIAVSRGAKVSHANDIDTAIRGLCNGQGADLVMVDTTLDIAHLVSRLKNERISIPVVACGVDDDAKVAVAAIKAEGHHARAMMPSATEALTGPTRHATIPKMVATGAAGAATALATTAQRGMMGLSRIRIGWHAICAASGTASTRARPEGMNRESFVVTGPVSNKIPPVATTERAKAKSKASHGSSARRTKTVTPNTGIPRTGLAEATHTNTIEAMMEALMSFKRAGADAILTYAAMEAAELLDA